MPQDNEVEHEEGNTSNELAIEGSQSKHGDLLSSTCEKIIVPDESTALPIKKPRFSLKEKDEQFMLEYAEIQKNFGPEMEEEVERLRQELLLHTSNPEPKPERKKVSLTELFRNFQ